MLRVLLYGKQSHPRRGGPSVKYLTDLGGPLLGAGWLSGPNVTVSNASGLVIDGSRGWLYQPHGVMLRISEALFQL